MPRVGRGTAGCSLTGTKLALQLPSCRGCEAGARGDTPFPSTPNNSQENSKPGGKAPSCKPGERDHASPPSRGRARKGQAVGVQRGSPLPIAAGTQHLLVVLSGSVQGKRDGAQPLALDTASPTAPGQGGEEQQAPARLNSGGWIWGALCSPWGWEPGSGQAGTDRGGGRTAGHQRGDRQGRTSPSTSQILPPHQARTDQHKQPRETTLSCETGHGQTGHGAPRTGADPHFWLQG